MENEIATKVAKCPDCKSEKGVRVKYSIEGNGWEDRDFNGNVLHAHREMIDKIKSYAICLNCRCQIDIDLIDQ